MAERNRALTTGEVAQYCGVNFRTVIRWIDQGYLKAYKLPGRGDNRIAVRDFISFMKTHSIPTPPEFHDNSRRVLIVDDDPSMVRAIQRILERREFETMSAADGFQAGSLLESFAPALITLDIRMPGLSGHDVVTFVRRTPRLSHVKILIVSAMSSRETGAAIEAGADDLLRKPFSNDELIEKVSRLAGLPPDGLLPSLSPNMTHPAPRDSWS